MNSKSIYRGLLVTVLTMVAAAIAVLALPRPTARYIVVPCVLLAAAGLALFARDFHASLKG